MLSYHGKLLELLSIERTSNKSFLRIRLSFEQEIEIFWDIDDETAENLESSIDFEDNYKYRLSFQSFWDSTRKQYVSFVTKTYLDHSNRIYFSCSEDYVNGLSSLRCIQQVNDIDTLSFLSSHLSTIEVPEHIHKQDQEQDHEELKSDRHMRYYTWIVTTMICVISTFLFKYSYDYFINHPVFHKRTTATAAMIDDKIHVKQETKKIRPASGEVKSSTIEPNIPFVKLNIVKNFSVPKGNLALTFDDGPSKYTKAIVDILKKYQVGGTFFFIGLNVKKYPDNVRYVKANGYSVGSHSMTHTDFSNISYEKQENEIIETNKLIEQIIFQKVVLFRPPYGANNESTIDLMNKHHIKMVLWNKDPQDWKSHNSEEVFHYVQGSKESGSILLLHESQTVVNALPKIIKYLQGQNLRIVSLR